MSPVDEPFVRRRSKSRKPDKKPLPLWQETILLLGIALVLAIVIKMFFVQAFYIPSPSMEPLFVKNDRILVEKVSYWGGGTPQPGDVVVFKDPGGWLDQEESQGPSSPIAKVLEKIGLYPSGGHLVKRVIGVGGDRVKCCDAQGRVTVNGHPLNEKSYLPKGTKPSLTRFDVMVPPGHLWVMGDNRGDSYDSRGHMGGPGGGFVPDNLVVGKVVALIWPWDRMKIIHRPATFEGIPNAS
ncbi:MAG TPA: signal peptidase I [Marmoricola sp.]|nr:signal peptidase I [Marmoricola sp.]